MRVEKRTVKPGGRRGRMDIFVDVTEKDDELVAIAEIKASDWDRMSSQVKMSPRS